MPLNVGDEYTIANIWERRTLWQWLLRRPRRLRRGVVASWVSAAYDEGAAHIRTSPPIEWYGGYDVSAGPKEKQS